MNYFNLNENNSDAFYKFKKNDRQYQQQQQQQKGGADENNYSSSLIFNAIKEDNYNTLNFLINQKDIISINFKDTEGSTILHILINKLIDRNQNENIMTVIENILQRPDVNNIINIQDNNGNTPLHLCVISKNYILCDRLISVGANPLIKNNVGLYVESETDSITQKACASAKKTNLDLDNVFISRRNLESLKNNDNDNDNDKDKDKDIIKHIIDSLTSNLNNPSSTASEEKQFINGNITIDDTSAFIGKLINTENKHYNPNNDKILENLSHVINIKKFIGRDKDEDDDKDDDDDDKDDDDDDNMSQNLSDKKTSDFLKNFIDKYKIRINNKGGGPKKIIKRIRKLNTNTDYNNNSLELPQTSVSSIISKDSNSETDSETDSGSDSGSETASVTNKDSISELSRIINNKATEIHERIVKKIAELLKISEQEARVIKAYIYNEVKNKHPELNNFDRAVEMEKKLTIEYLQTLNKKKLKELSEIMSEKQKSSSVIQEKSKKFSMTSSMTSSMPDSSSDSS